MPFARAQAATAQTDASLVAAPGAGKQIAVYHVFASSAVAGSFTLESGTAARRWEAYVAANGSVSDDAAYGELFRCADNAALTYSTTGTGNQFIQVHYGIVPTTGT
jgi:hypothetical protein